MFDLWILATVISAGVTIGLFRLARGQITSLPITASLLPQTGLILPISPSPQERFGRSLRISARGLSEFAVKGAAGGMVQGINDAEDPESNSLSRKLIPAGLTITEELEPAMALMAMSLIREEIAMVAYSGWASIPKRVYVNDAKNLSLTLNPEFPPDGLRGKRFEVRDTRTGKSFVMAFPIQTAAEHFLEVELQAAALKIAGDKRQRQPLTAPKLEYNWNCHFPTSGNLEIALVFRLVSDQKPPREESLGRAPHTVKVAQLDHLTKRWVWILGIIATLITSTFAIKVFTRLGWL